VHQSLRKSQHPREVWPTVSWPYRRKADAVVISMYVILKYRATIKEYYHSWLVLLHFTVSSSILSYLERYWMDTWQSWVRRFHFPRGLSVHSFSRASYMFLDTTYSLYPFFLLEISSLAFPHCSSSARDYVNTIISSQQAQWKPPINIARFTDM